MIEVWIDGNRKYVCSDLSEVRGVLQSHIGVHIGVWAVFEARNPQDEWVEYKGAPDVLIQQLDDEWAAYKIAHRAFWNY